MIAGSVWKNICQGYGVLAGQPFFDDNCADDMYHRCLLWRVGPNM